MLKFLTKLLGPNTGVSIKRFIGLISSLSIIIISFIDLFTNYSVTDYVFEGLVWLAIGGIFGVASEKFADAWIAKNTKNNTTDTDLPGSQKIDNPGE